MATEKRLIEPNALIEEITVMKKIDPYKKRRGLIERWVRNEGYNILLLLVKHFPTVEAVEVVHGRWEPHPHAYGFERCSVCHDCCIWGEWADGKKWSYCPNCGAKMDGDGNG